VAQLFADMAITITAAAVFASLTLVPMLSGLFLNQAEAQQMFQGGDYSDRNWFESDRADIGSFRRLQSKLEKIFFGNGRLVTWSPTSQAQTSTTIDSRRAPGC